MTTRTGPPPVIGLRREREVLTVALAAGRHVVIEGPPGTGKSTLLREIARDTGQAVIFVEGNAELTPARLVGQHDPAQVLAGGYTPDSFTDGPLLTAMRGGALLYLEEFNRIPEETLNVLITVLAEGEIAVPRLGMVAADPGFRLIAAMNPFDAIGTARVSQAVADRICRIVLGYQDAAAERDITAAVSGGTGPGVTFAVELTRATRVHPDIRMGASVRGAIDLVLLLTGLVRLRGEPGLSPETGLAWDTARDAAYAALSGRIRVADGCDRSPESVLDELLAGLWPDPDPVDPGQNGTDGTAPPGGQGKADGLPPGAGGRPERASRSSLRRDRRRGPARRTASRAELAAQHAAFGDVSPEVGELDEAALARLLEQDPDAAATLLADLALATDRALAAAARRLAARVFVRFASGGSRPARGTRRLGPGRGDGDLDLDRTLDRLSGSWPPPPADLVTRTWQARRRALCLLIDTSGSMSGLAVAIAAVAASAVMLAAAGRHDAGVIAFSSEVSELHAPGSGRPPGELVGELVALRGHGTTDLAAALRAAARQLAGCRADERVVILLSDCLRTAGGDPAGALAGIDRLQVLCPLPSGPDHRAEQAAAALARRGGGISQPVRGLADVGPALTRVLA
ncbi:MAG TPA: MoxR family ATPase [Streptosporangiaceae bacterium]|jgi:MoxR-like ATPase/Mg-chelatase subunit ChlD|nr:MoxR family ATPase [Streptosporangiaceae bacterium]